jgi:hypothetical protein
MFDSRQEPDVAAEMARELGLNPALDNPVDEPLLEELQRGQSSDTAFSRRPPDRLRFTTTAVRTVS